jgi:hypothetical protein
MAELMQSPEKIGPSSCNLRAPVGEGAKPLNLLLFDPALCRAYPSQSA